MKTNEISQNEPIRYIYDENSRKFYFSIVDIVGIITDSTDARNYWKVLKNRLKKAQNKLVTECNQLKMQSIDGKFYLTDAGDKETILNIVEIISPQYIPHFHQYFTTIKPKKSINILSLKEESSDVDEQGEYTYPQSSEISKNIHDLRIKKVEIKQQKKIRIKSI